MFGHIVCQVFDEVFGQVVGHDAMCSPTKTEKYSVQVFRVRELLKTSSLFFFFFFQGELYSQGGSKPEVEVDVRFVKFVAVNFSGQF